MNRRMSGTHMVKKSLRYLGYIITQSGSPNHYTANTCHVARQMSISLLYLAVQQT